MGCGSSHSYRGEVYQTWDEVQKTVKKRSKGKLIVKRSGWKTIRIFVSSTFRDFHAEREILVKEVFPDLRVWCEKRRLYLVDCDLRWGVPKDTTTEETLRTCLGEIDRCYSDNVMPFFLNLTSERCGWIPNRSEVPQSVIDEYMWVMGLSVTEMELIHGAYRVDNPNALFMIRDANFLNSVPEEHQQVFVDPNPIAADKLKMLKDMLKSKFPSSQVAYYKCEFEDIEEDGRVHLKGLDKRFKERVYEFFQKRIMEQYPLENVTTDPYQQAQEAHESFMKSRSAMVLGRNEILQKISDHITGIAIDRALIILGGPGMGKSSIMAKVADEAVFRAAKKQIPGGGDAGWLIFYHFVGAVPGSTDPERALKRMLKEMGIVNEATMPTDMETTCQMVSGVLSNPNTRPTVIVIDAVNQFDDDKMSLSWLPRRLAPQIRVVMSMINNTPPHKILRERTNPADEAYVTPLDMQSRREIVTQILGSYNKRLDEEQMTNLLSKDSSQNPLWLAIACEELRVYGVFHMMNEKIDSLASGLLELLAQVLKRFEEENGGHLLVATLCLLESSATGLLEVELLEILSDEENLMAPDSSEGKATGHAQKPRTKKSDQLPAVKWAAVYRALKPFLRPFGDSGEGRLDFYHRSLSKAVRHMYFLNDDGNENDDDSRDIYQWWHKKLADYFEMVDNLERKIEEYPVHLVKINDKERLKQFLMQWPVFDNLYDEEYSSKLLYYWRKAGGAALMEKSYLESLDNLKNRVLPNKDELSIRYEQISRVLMQEGQLETSHDLLQKAMSLEEDDLGGRPERLVELYDLAANIYNGKIVLIDYVSRSMLPVLRPCIDFRQRGIKLRETFEGNRHKFKRAYSMMKLAFNIKTWYMIGGDTNFSAEEAMEEGFRNVREAKAIFQELGEDGYRAECLMNEGLLVGEHDQEKALKLYQEAEELCLQVYGENSVLSGRLLMNTGILVEEMGNYEEAYNYFSRAFKNKVEVYGLDHPQTLRAIRLIEEPMYKRIAQSRGENLLEEYK
ncbi:telomerase protein component 1-like [Glandiceps talaboti]